MYVLFSVEKKTKQKQTKETTKLNAFIHNQQFYIKAFSFGTSLMFLLKS